MIEQLKTIREDAEWINNCNTGGMLQGRARNILEALTQLEAMVGEPVARLHITETDTYPDIEVEVLDGIHLQPGMSPIPVYVAAPAAQQYEAGDMASAAAQGFRGGVASVTQGEPVAWMWKHKDGSIGFYRQDPATMGIKVDHPNYIWTKLYAAPVAQQPQAESLESLLSTAIGLLMGYEDRDGKGEARNPYKPGSAVANFVAECVERLKDWPMTDSTQQPQAKPHKPLFADLIAQHPGLREELLEMDKQPQAEAVTQPEGRCRWCLTYNGHQDGCPEAPQQAEAVPPDVVRDAAAYHWLTTTLTSPEPWVVFQKAFGHMTEERPPTKAELDAAIYAAIAQQKGQP